MTFRKIEEADVDIVRGLYTKIKDFNIPPRINLPGNGLDGYVAVSEDGLIIGATYVYLGLNAPVCWIEWTISNRDYRGKDRKEILPKLLKHACSEMKKAGYGVAFAFASEPQMLINKYEQAGFEHDGHWCRELINWL